MDWDIQLRQIDGRVTPNGLFTLDRQPRPAAQAFRDLCARYRDRPLLEDFPPGRMQGPVSGQSVIQKLSTRVRSRIGAG